MDQNRMPLANALINYRESGRITMHIPGHKEGRGTPVPELDKLIGQRALGCDITEIAGFDDYHNPEGIIKEAEMLAAELFGADETHFLVNGTTSGIMAAVAAAALEGERIIVTSDCHKSVTRGIVISGADPIYADSDIDAETGLTAGVSAGKINDILARGGIKAVVLQNPSYYGTYSDLCAVVETAHSAGAAVIVDEAHGGHLRFSDQEHIVDAMAAGADVSVQSTHKMPGSLTQSSMLHVQGSIIDRRRLAYNVRMLTSTSPSYLLMGSLDAVRHRLALSGRGIWKDVMALTEKYSGLINRISGVECVRYFTDGSGVRKPLDGARLLISASERGISGYGLADILASDYSIDMEFADDRYVIAAAGTGSTEGEFAALLRALGNLPVSHPLGGAETAAAAAAAAGHRCEITPRKAVFSKHDVIELAYAVNRIAAEEIAVYPPGVPIVVTGEKFTQESVSRIAALEERGIHIHGIIKTGGKTMVSVVEDDEQSMLFNCLF